MFYGLTPKVVRRLVYAMAKANNMRIPEKWECTKQAGKDWLNSFLKRNPTCAIRTPEATSIARATTFNRYNVGAFFDILEKVVKDNITGARIFNLDESGFTTVQKVPKVVGPRGIKQVGQVTSRERGELTTVVGIISATGGTIPLVFVFPRKIFKDTMMHGAPEGSLGLVYQSGWMTVKNFKKVVEHVIKHTKSSVENPMILIMDNHDSHLGYDALQLAKSNGIQVITLPPHTSNKTQPLDRSVFGPMKVYFNQAADSWMMRNPGKTLSIFNIAQLVGEAWTKAATPQNILAGFKVSGIWPFDRNIFGDDEYLPSNVTDRERNENTETTHNEEVAHNEEVTHNDEELTHNEEEVIHNEEASSNKDEVTRNEAVTNNQDQVNQNEEATPQPVRPTAKPNRDSPAGPSPTFDIRPNYVTAKDLMGFPKAPPRKQRIGRKCGKTMLATASPEMKRIRQEQEVHNLKKAKRSLKLNFDSKKSLPKKPSVGGATSQGVKQKPSKAALKAAKAALHSPACRARPSDSSASSLSLTDDSEPSEDENKDEDDTVNDKPTSPNVDDWVLAKFVGKKSIFHYVGQVVEINEEEEEITVMWLRRARKTGTFSFPQKDDIWAVPLEDIVLNLPPPSFSGGTARAKKLLSFGIDLFEYHPQ